MSRVPRLAVAGLGLLLVACVPLLPNATPTATPSTTLTPAPSVQVSEMPSPASRTAVVLAAGDIAGCDSDGDEATAALLDRLNGTVLALGDLAYPDGTDANIADCYSPTWGRFRNLTWPTPGNHDYRTASAEPYYAYWSDRVVGPQHEYYLVPLGTWWVISLNSNCDEVGGCGPDSAQAAYLSDLLDTIDSITPNACILAFWHHPRWSSGAEHGSDARTDTFWRRLAIAGADIVLSGHDHDYERFAPMNADGAADPNGMVEFVVGTGGRPLYTFGQILPTSAVHDNSTWGVLQLTLHPGGYDWAFVSTVVNGFTDSGSADCR